ncbi:protein of unknown function [Prauserella marina]|uniref:Uncharacterized protein n=2 Tax=Prauserella marina TaxID=530584 RepID=A0A1G6SVV7_9PSEU|nr:uncharacterized protein DUF1707 [Prauserella marina]SDD20406.1 protein of unknown function [Prauserella marina]
MTDNDGTEQVPDEVTRQRNMRVSDSEREHVVELLQKAIGRGMLNLDEFTERTDIALASRTRGELNAVLVDLPGLVHPEASPLAPQAPAPSAPSAPGYPGQQRMELKAHGSTLTRKGRWHVPAELLVRNKYGETKLDFSEADITSQVVNIELDTKWSTVTLTIPDSAAVDLNGLGELKWSTVTDKTNSNGRTGIPRLVVTGRVYGGTLIIKYPRRGLFS